MDEIPPLDKLLGTDSAAVKVTKINGNFTILASSFNELIARLSGQNLPPVAAFTLSQANTMSVTVDGSGSTDPDGTIATWSWDFGDGVTAATATPPAHTYKTAGAYTITLTVTDNLGSTASTTRQITAVALPAPTNEPPTASFTATTASDGITVSVDASASKDVDGTIVGYAWAFGDGGTATTKTATHVYTASGSFAIKLVVTDDDGATGALTKNVTITVPAPPAPPTPSTAAGDPGINQTGVAARQQTGTGTKDYATLAGSTVGDKINAGAGSIVSLAAGTFSFSDFAQSIGSGVPAGAALVNTVKGLYGAGSKSTVLQMAANTSTKTYPTGSGGGTNPSYLMGVKGSVPSGFVIDGIMLLGTTQGNPDFNGFWTQNPTNMTVSNSTFKHCHGSAGGPPGETFAFNVYSQASGTINFKHCTFDGDNVGAAGLGTNTTSGTINIDDCVAKNMAQSAGVATWENRGTINVRNLVMTNNHRNFGAETNAGTINIYDPVWGEPTAGNDFNITWTNNFHEGTINIYFSSAAAWQAFIAARTTKKIKVVTNARQNYGGSAGSSYTGSGDIWKAFNVYVAGVLQAGSTASSSATSTSTAYVNFTGYHTAA